MTRTTKLFFFAFAITVAACASKKPRPAPSGQTIQTGTPEIVTVAGANDAGVGQVVTVSNKSELCGVRIVWDYAEQKVKFNNASDRIVRASVGWRHGKNLMPNGKGSVREGFRVGSEMIVAVESMDFQYPNDPGDDSFDPDVVPDLIVKNRCVQKFVLGR